MIGSGVLHGMHGHHHGIGGIIQVGGTHITVGHMIGTGIIAMHSIITIIGALSVRDIMYIMDGMSYIVV
jgi:hypothetical protein